MFPLKHVTSAWLTAENNLGLQASGWLTQTLLLFLSSLTGGLGFGLMGIGEIKSKQWRAVS